MKDIVVLAGSTPWSVLSLCKSASKNKAKAYIVCINNGWGRKYIKSRYVYKAYDIDEASINSLWQQFFKENHFAEKPILYVTNDYVCQVVEQNRAFYEACFDLCMASSYIIHSFIDKNLAAIEAEKHGLAVPMTLEIHQEADLDGIRDSFKFPAIVKPVTFRDHSKVGFKTQVCETEQQLKEFVKQHLVNGINLQCQEFIKGEDKDCVFYQFYRDKDGNVTECMGEKTLQTEGIMTIGTTKLDVELAAMCKSFLNSIDYKGIGGIEFKKYSGKYYFIEMSTRTEGFLPVSDMAGVSLAEASYLSMNGLRFKTQRQNEDIQYVVFMTLLIASFREKGFIYACKRLLGVLFSPKAHFTGAFLDFCFALKLDLRIIK